jgi:hypothetical protein
MMAIARLRPAEPGDDVVDWPEDGERDPQYQKPHRHCERGFDACLQTFDGFAGVALVK